MRVSADRRGWPFFDLDKEIERHFGLSSERLQARFLTSYSCRQECAVVLGHIAGAYPDCVIALPSGLRDAFLRVIRRMLGVTVAVQDTPENILERITFYDIDSRRIEKYLTAKERITITGLDPEVSAAAIDVGWAVPERASNAPAPRLGSLRRSACHPRSVAGWQRQHPVGRRGRRRRRSASRRGSMPGPGAKTFPTAISR